MRGYMVHGTRGKWFNSKTQSKWYSGVQLRYKMDEIIHWYNDKIVNWYNSTVVQDDTRFR